MVYKREVGYVIRLLQALSARLTVKLLNLINTHLQVGDRQNGWRSLSSAAHTLLKKGVNELALRTRVLVETFSSRFRYLPSSPRRLPRLLRC